MATSITIISVNRPHSVPGIQVQSTVDFYLYDGTNLWLQSIPIDPLLTLSQIQSLLDSQSATLLNAAQSDTPYSTGQNALILLYARQHMDNRRIFSRAWFVLEDGIRTIPSFTLANYQTALTAALTVINTLPAVFLTHLNNERTAYSLTMAPSAMGLAQCQAFDTLLHGWINARLVGSLIAPEVLNWLIS